MRNQIYQRRNVHVLDGLGSVRVASRPDTEDARHPCFHTGGIKIAAYSYALGLRK
ncbi:hypothetical protein ADIAG_00289 [Paeniglutamicibacter gangotriensis Lz1y]|uniref:Uncharacterized protein n=1 Tax=Paeniglutamicibacter gangotriensis Lz1y TaxID=1276920 RepID=M7MZ27_9MICC|nr:hypothetical protein ADIAG_00289 [Paeniglutamicibacter gangotriensis Lz1y]